MIVGLNGELSNADRLQALIEQAIEARADQPGLKSNKQKSHKEQTP